MDLTKELNTAQIKAVEQIEGPCMIVAGAGSGKTRVLTYKIAYLIESGISPFEILALTFTNKAANEMKQRIYKLVGNSAGNIWMGTFHSIFARILRIEAQHIGFDRNFTIYDDDDSDKLVETVMKDLGFATDNPKPRTVSGRIKELKNKLILPDDIVEVTNPFEKIATPVYKEYQSRLLKNNAMDFDDLLINPILLFRSNNDVLEKYQNRFKFILVDEYQDTNRAQYEIVKMLSYGHGNISIVGDDAQSIYRWRGAEIENIFKFGEDFKDCKVFKLEQNYRSTKNILSLADDVIKNNKRQIQKTLFTDNTEGDLVTLTEVFNDRDEAMIIIKWIMNEISNRKLNFKDFVILYRTNAQSRVIEDALRMNSIPYIIVGGVKFYQRREIKDVLAYLKVLVNPKDDEAMTRILKLRDGIGEQTVDRLKRAAKEIAKSICEYLVNMIDEREGQQKRTRIEAELLRVAGLIRKYSEVKNEFSPSELARSIVDEIGIIRQLRNEGTDEAMDRMYNVQELLSGISEYTDNTAEATLEGFLQEVSLVTDIDTYDDQKNAVTLMTTHSSKGLEFPVVFITGLEDGIFPLSSSSLAQEEMEEERRLFYVAITRAMQKLYMTYSLQRYRFGNVSYQMKSRFLKEIDTSRLQYSKAHSLGRQKNKMLQEEGSSIRYEYYGDNGSGDDVLAEMFREELGIKKGSVVYHNNFGKGKVLDVTGRGDSRKAQIEFEKVGVKNIILKYANLTLK
ncbi:MAG: UvrD-helicase domain-containing protein [Chlorobi bacterium]|nr:UvrD-helicase domain-containing protein [Chlorobiota bacterium]MCI0716704.1 UvrD-helicase domain-containing protein [Chlorobiota bacterium]